MMCTRCNNLLQKVLYKCVDCFNDGIEDSIMCESCKEEHIEANEGNTMNWEIIRSWEEMPENV